MKRMLLTLLAVSLGAAMLWGCGSNRSSDGAVVGGDDTLANAAAVGISNCLTCHNPGSTLVQEWMASRHGNHLLIAGRLANDVDEELEDDPRPSSCAYECHDPFNDRDDLDLSTVIPFAPAGTDWSEPGSFVGCEACHGGGQFHNGIAAGIPFPEPSTNQCAECHYLNDDLAKEEWLEEEGFYPHHTTSSKGNNVRRNIFDSHVDDPATDYNSELACDDTKPETYNPDICAPNIIEGYVVKTEGVGGCKDCHVAHDFDLTINYQWGNSAHGGHIKAIKDAVLLAAGLPVDSTDEERLQLLADVTKAGVDSSTGDGWVHYDWDAGNRQSCQRCHTATGLVNFLADTENYDLTANDFSHLSGWSKAADDTVTSSGQNEMLYCWGCHADTQTGEVRDDPAGITLDFESLVGPSQDPSGDREFVLLPDKGDSNVCAACHAGRGNNTSIRDRYADAAAATDPDDRELSSRFAGHHAPTAGSLYAEVTHTGFEFDGQDYTPLNLQHDLIDEDVDGPCVSCHMGGPDEPNHTFESVTEDEATHNIIAINNQALCDGCHEGGVVPATLNTLRTEFDEARQILLDLVDNIEPRTNYLGLDISASINRTVDKLLLNDYGAFQNSVYMTEEPCIYVHNSLYAKRLIFDSIDWLEDGIIDGTIADYGAANTWLGGTTRPGNFESAGEAVYVLNCSGCHGLGTFDPDIEVGGAGDLSGKEGLIDGKFPVPDESGHKGITLSSQEITDLKVFVAAN